MKKLILTSVFSLGLAAASFGQGFWNFDNSATFDGGTSAIADYIGTPNVAGEGATGAYLGSGATPNYDVSYLYLAGTAFSGSSLTPAAFIADGASFANSFNNAPATFVSYAAITGDTADGAGFFQGGGSHITGAADGSLYTIQIIAWYDPTGTTSFQQAFAQGFNTGGSSLNTIRMAAGLDTTIADAGGYNGFAVTSVPEPATFALAGLGSLGLLLFRRRQS